jgi:branched-chain amino acid transport system ATP-binding protein
MSAAVLEIRGLAKAFGGVHAVRDVSFDVNAGELVALIGPNGAGKTTCFNLVNGQLSPDAGSVLLEGKPITGLPPRAIARLGVGRTFQVAATFASMTVRENVAVALAALGGEVTGADAILARVGAADLADAHTAALPYSDAKRVELALAIAGNPHLLLMDEPAAGMAPRERAVPMQLARTLARDHGIAVLFTEHDMDIVFGHADRVIVLDRGEIIAQGTPEAIRADPMVRAVYLGDAQSATLAR